MTFARSPLALSMLAGPLAFMASAHAATAGVELPSMKIDGTHLAIEERREAISPRVVMDGRDLRRYGNGSLGDALRRMNGLYFGGPPGENKDLRLRGLDKEYSQVLIDGRRMPDSGEKREVQLDKIPLAMVDRIELIRSPNATMDAQGVGGTLNIIMKKRTSDERQVILGYASGDERPDDGSLQFSWGRADTDHQWLLAGGRQSRSVPKAKEKLTATGSGAFNGGEEEVELKRTFENYLTPHWSWSPVEGERFSLDLLLLDSRQDKEKTKTKIDKDRLFNGKELEGEHAETRNWGVDLGWQHDMSDSVQLDSYLNLRQLKESKDKDKLVYNKNLQQTSRESEDEQKRDHELQFGQRLDLWLGESHELSTGYDAAHKSREKEKSKLKNGVASSEAKDHYELEEDRFDLYLSDLWSIAPAHSVQPGLRWENSRLRSQVPGMDAVDERESFLAPSLHYRWVFADSWALRASAARTIRRPKFDDIIPSQGFESGANSNNAIAIGNPGLTPEKAWSYDLGLDRYLGNDDGVLGLNLFRRDIQDLMESVTFLDPADGRYYTQTQNTGDGRLWGAELEFTSDLGWLGMEGLRANAGYSWLDSEVKDKASGQTRRFKQQPGYLANVGLEYRFPGTGLTLGGSWNRVGDYEDEITGTESKLLGDIEYVDLFLNADLTDYLTLRLAAENIGSAKKEENKTTYNPNGTVKSRELNREFSEPLYSASLEVRW